MAHGIKDMPTQTSCDQLCTALGSKCSALCAFDPKRPNERSAGVGVYEDDQGKYDFPLKTCTNNTGRDANGNGAITLRCCCDTPKGPPAKTVAGPVNPARSCAETCAGVSKVCDSGKLAVTSSRATWASDTGSSSLLLEGNCDWVPPAQTRSSDGRSYPKLLSHECSCVDAACVMSTK